MHDFGAAIGATIVAVIGLAALAVFVSSNAQSSQIITSSGTALSGVIQAAVAPVSTGNSVINSSALMGNSNGALLT